MIATPTVTNIIEDSKMQSYIRTAEGLLSSVDTKTNINMAYNFRNKSVIK